MQLAGHLRGRALQEWNLLSDGDKGSYAAATQALRNRLDPGGRALAAQDFHHTVQGETELVADFIRCMSRTHLPDCIRVRWHVHRNPRYTSYSGRLRQAPDVLYVIRKYAKILQ